MPATPAEVAVGLDLGTSGLKAVAVDAGGPVVAFAEAPYPTRRPGPGRAEQDPADWRRAVGEAVAALAGAVDPAGWVALGLTGMIPTLVACDAEGAPLGTAITWEDARAERQAEMLRAAVGEAALYELTGQWVDGRYLLPMLAWIAEREPERAERIRLALGAKDFLFAWLTGERATDPATATGFGCFDLDAGGWNADLPAAARLGSTPALPEVRPATSTAPLRPDAADELGLPAGLPVCLGAADSVVAARGLGATRPGRVAYVAGSSTVILGVVDRPRRDPRRRYLVTPLAEPGLWGIEMDLLSTGSAVAWLAGVLGLGPEGEDEVWALAARSPLGARGVAFLPYLGVGEQGALWDPSLRGAIGGLTLAHAREDLARALLEGVVLESRRCVARLEEAGLSEGSILATGYGAAAPALRQALADATGRSVAAPGGPAHPASAWGAASLAWSAAAGVEVPLPGDGDPTIPDPASAPEWKELWERHERLRSGLAAESEG